MKGVVTRLIVIVSALAFTLSIVQPPRTYASGQAEPDVDVEVTVKVTEKGFLDNRNRPLGPKNPLKVQKGQVVKITFEFAESLNSLAVGDTHQVAIISDDGWAKETDKIWVFNRKTALTFRAGENGRMKYRAYCTLDCIGMERLNNLVIRVV